MIYRTRDAVNAILPNADCRIEDEKITIWREDSTEPTQIEIDAKLVELQAEYDAQEYARNRASEYPSLLELTVALYDTDDKSAVEAKRAAVKAKYPKPS